MIYDQSNYILMLLICFSIGGFAQKDTTSINKKEIFVATIDDSIGSNIVVINYHNIVSERL